MASVKLIGARPSPFVNRVQIALNLKSINYEFFDEIFGSKSKFLLESNPVHKKIPVLIHDDKPICESLIIVQYIDEQWTSGPSILPSDPYDRSTAQFWASYIDEKCFSSLGDLRLAKGEAEKLAAANRLFEMLVLLEEVFAKCSEGGKGFFGGDKIGYLDIALGGFLGWLKAVERLVGVMLLDGKKTPELVGWAERFCADDAVKGVIPETEELLEFAEKSLPKA
ncbi:hypothetical protein Vadar_016823 [Vaccinium darrowii]|uniref:Uncharacterized protein n=1 Tax=Vaccinium darrowii TaxID=229202 RepID=A0ACB7X1Z6_9ERIC|nr:hypothetical protein Vadar_016823 [Vaccinium darrowii]